MKQKTKFTYVSARRRRHAGLSMVEVLISLAITALLLTATAVAFDAALTSYKANHDISMVNVAARNAVARIVEAYEGATLFSARRFQRARLGPGHVGIESAHEDDSG